MKQESILGNTFLMVCAIWGGLIFLAGTTVLPYSPISPSPVTKLIVRSFLPEGWSFFTRNPREAQLHFFKYENTHLSPYQNFPNSNPTNYFGMSRKSRAQGVEFAYLTQDISPENWKDCTRKELLNKVLTDSIPWIDVQSPYAPSLLCGEIVVMEEEYVPWAWSQSSKEIDMPAKFIKLNISCN